MECENSQISGFAEHFTKGEGCFSNSFKHVPIESHGINSSNTFCYRMNFKQMLMGDDAHTWCIDENFTKEML